MNIKIFPNPTNGIINIETLGLSNEIQVEVVNIFGQVIINEKIISKNVTENIFERHIKQLFL